MNSSKVRRYNSNEIPRITGILPPKKFKELHDKAKVGTATDDDFYNLLPKKYMIKDPNEREEIIYANIN
jgi:hypothetical protein